jgi:hypothetical protein
MIPALEKRSAEEAQTNRLVSWNESPQGIPQAVGYSEIPCPMIPSLEAQNKTTH